MAFRSIRWRLQAWYGFILLAVLAALGIAAYELQRARIYHEIDDGLVRRAGEVASTFRGPMGPGRGQPGLPPREDPLGLGRRPGPPDEPDEPGPPPDQDRPFDGGRPKGADRFHLPPRMARLFESGEDGSFYYVIWSGSGSEIARSTNAPENVVRPRQSPSNGPPLPITREKHRQAEVSLSSGETILVGRDISREQGDLRRAAWTLAGVGLLVLAFGLAGGWWVSSAAIRPIQNISGTAMKIAGGDLAQRISIRETESELGHLAEVLNGTFARLEASFMEQKQFTSDAAHELRTPVAVVLAQTQTALNRERSAAEYKQTIEACQRAAQRMKRLIESLLELARFDAGQEPLKKKAFDLATTTADSIDLVAPLAAERNVTITSDISSMPCMGDQERIGQVITNLLTNSIQYNREGGSVRVTGEQQNGFVRLSIEDTGMGIPQTDLPNLFKRFFRGDKSRTGGRNGLGLSISKTIMEAHAGSIEVLSHEGVGSKFTIQVPAAPGAVA